MNHDPNLSVYATRYTWDLLENLGEVVDNQNNIKTYRYDCLGRKIFLNDPNRGRMYYTYDDAGNMKENIDNKDQIIRFSYDSANRILTEDYIEDINQIEVKYFYDTPSLEHPDAANLKGLLSYVTDQSCEEYPSYDNRGNPVWIIKKVTINGKEKEYWTSMTYDVMHRIHSYMYPVGKRITYLYNARSLLKYITNFINQITYSASGSIQTIQYTNGFRTDHG